MTLANALPVGVRTAAVPFSEGGVPKVVSLGLAELVGVLEVGATRGRDRRPVGTRSVPIVAREQDRALVGAVRVHDPGLLTRRIREAGESDLPAVWGPRWHVGVLGNTMPVAQAVGALDPYVVLHVAVVVVPPQV